MLEYVLVLLKWGGCSLIGLVAFLLFTMKKVGKSVRVLPPRDPMADLEQCALFQYLPMLKDKIAWTQLAEVLPTPIHECRFMSEGVEVQFWMKREDMASSEYGGNKVRTLEFQLPCAILAVEQQLQVQQNKGNSNLKGVVYAVGGPGSNQTVAACCHFERVKDKLNVLQDISCENIYLFPEAPSRDNGLNLLSCFSYPGSVFSNLDGYAKPFKTLINALYLSRNKILPPGGANECGTLGHVAAILEVCQKIEQRKLDDLDAIFLPRGSGCTTAGLLAGISLSRVLQKKAFLNKNFTIHSVIIHPWFSSLLYRMGCNEVIDLARRSLELIKSLGGPDALNIFENDVKNRVRFQCDYAGTYGVFLPEGVQAKAEMEKAKLCCINNESATPLPWIDSCFTNKSLVALLTYLKENPGQKVLLWQTKSLVQPLGPENSWEKSQRELGKHGKNWLKDGGFSNGAGDYVHLCKQVTAL